MEDGGAKVHLQPRNHSISRPEVSLRRLARPHGTLGFLVEKTTNRTESKVDCFQLAFSFRCPARKSCSDDYFFVSSVEKKCLRPASVFSSDFSSESPTNSTLISYLHDFVVFLNWLRLPQSLFTIRF